MSVKPANMVQWEEAEIKRSSIEAGLTDLSSFNDTEENLSRYLNPPMNTLYYLEYSYHLLGDVRGKLVLDYGCGIGDNSLLLARRQAQVYALDISMDLIKIAQRRLVRKGVYSGVQFISGSAHEIPLPDESVDVVFGMAVLHHLNLELAAREVHRVLKKGGRAIFQEPMRNSKILKWVRALIPYQAPDVSPYERPLTTAEINRFGEAFSKMRSKDFRLPWTGLVDAVPFFRKYERQFFEFDATLIARYPVLRYYSTVKVFDLVK